MKRRPASNLKSKRGSALRGRGRKLHSIGGRDTSKTEIGRIFSPCHSIDILLYVADHPGCKKVDIYRDVTRNSSTVSRIGIMEDAGLLSVEDHGRVTFLSLTDKGRTVARLFREAEGLVVAETEGS